MFCWLRGTAGSTRDCKSVLRGCAPVYVCSSLRDVAASLALTPSPGTPLAPHTQRARVATPNAASNAGLAIALLCALIGEAETRLHRHGHGLLSRSTAHTQGGLDHKPLLSHLTCMACPLGIRLSAPPGGSVELFLAFSAALAPVAGLALDHALSERPRPPPSPLRRAAAAAGGLSALVCALTERGDTRGAYEAIFAWFAVLALERAWEARTVAHWRRRRSHLLLLLSTIATRHGPRHVRRRWCVIR